MAGIDLEQVKRTRGVDLAVWPPRYDPTWRPPPDAEHWLPQVECAEPAARDELVLAKLRHQLRWAWERSPFYRRKWLEPGVSPDPLRSRDDLPRFPAAQTAALRLARAP